MDDQRCELPRSDASNISNIRPVANASRRPVSQSNSTSSNSLQLPSAMKPSVSTENLFDILQRVQGNRIEEQRFEMPPLPGLDPVCKYTILKSVLASNLCKALNQWCKNVFVSFFRKICSKETFWASSHNPSLHADFKDTEIGKVCVMTPDSMFFL